MRRYGVCKFCGCTEDNPCTDSVGDPCDWSDDAHTACTACAEDDGPHADFRNTIPPASADAILAALTDPGW